MRTIDLHPLALASQLIAADADHDAREHLQNMREERARAERDEGPEPDAADWYGRPEPITDELKARADAEWLASDAKGRLPE